MSAPIQGTSQTNQEAFKTWARKAANYTLESAAGYAGASVATAYAPGVAFKILAAKYGQVIAYYMVGELFKSGAFACAGPVGAAAAVVGVKYGPPLAKWGWKKCNEVVNDTKMRYMKTDEVALNKLMIETLDDEDFMVVDLDDQRKQEKVDLDDQRKKEVEAAWEEALYEAALSEYSNQRFEKNETYDELSLSRIQDHVKKGMTSTLRRAESF